MVSASCHPRRRHHAQGYCLACYARRVWKGTKRSKDGAFAEQRRREKREKSNAARSGPVVRFMPGTPEHDAIVRARR